MSEHRCKQMEFDPDEPHYEVEIVQEEWGWWLWVNAEYNVGPIVFCPYCGVRLTDETEALCQ